MKSTRQQCKRCRNTFTRPSTSTKKYCDPCRTIVLSQSAKMSAKNRDVVHVYSSNDNGDTVRIDKSGYAWVLVDGVWVSEHRYRMGQIIGRPLMKGESVHHKNGVRHDNRPENLELWVIAIRYGQRASDVVCPICKTDYLTAIKQTEGEPDETHTHGGDYSVVDGGAGDDS